MGFKEGFQFFKSPNNTGWEVTWTKLDNDGKYAAIMFSNPLLNQTVRLDEIEPGTYDVKVWGENGASIAKRTIKDYNMAKEFVINYMRNNVGNISASLRIKKIKEQVSDRGANREIGMFDMSTAEYIRMLNLVINNNNVPELVAKAKVIRDFIRKNV